MGRAYRGDPVAPAIPKGNGRPLADLFMLREKPARRFLTRGCPFS
jgi:hypothetical protein